MQPQDQKSHYLLILLMPNWLHNFTSGYLDITEHTELLYWIQKHKKMNKQGTAGKTYTHFFRNLK